MDVLANVVVLLHLAFFVFVAGGFVATLIGVMQRKPWAFHPGFRILHFSAVLLVIVEDWLAIDCPLNRLETQLRPVTTDANPGSLCRNIRWTFFISRWGRCCWSLCWSQDPSSALCVEDEKITHDCAIIGEDLADGQPRVMAETSEREESPVSKGQHAG